MFDFMHSKEFKHSLTDSTEKQIKKNIKQFKTLKSYADEYRAEQMNRISFWLNNSNCFFPENAYYKPIAVSTPPADKDSLVITNFEKVELPYSYTSPNVENCNNKIFLSVYFIDKVTMEVHHFAERDFGLNVKSLKILRFRIVADEKVRLLFLSDIFHN